MNARLDTSLSMVLQGENYQRQTSVQCLHSSHVSCGSSMGNWELMDTHAPQSLSGLVEFTSECGRLEHGSSSSGSLSRCRAGIERSKSRIDRMFKFDTAIVQNLSLTLTWWCECSIVAPESQVGGEKGYVHGLRASLRRHTKEGCEAVTMAAKSHSSQGQPETGPGRDT